MNQADNLTTGIGLHHGRNLNSCTGFLLTVNKEWNDTEASSLWGSGAGWKQDKTYSLFVLVLNSFWPGTHLESILLLNQPFCQTSHCIAIHTFLQNNQERGVRNNNQSFIKAPLNTGKFLSMGKLAEANLKVILTSTVQKRCFNDEFDKIVFSNIIGEYE